MIAVTICFTLVPGFRNEARAGKGTAFLGGMVASRILTGAVAPREGRTRAEEYQAYGPPRTHRPNEGEERDDT